MSNAKREAGPTIQGYNYQFLQSVLAWIELPEDQVLYLECGEDIDIQTKDQILFVQVKRKKRKITLRSPDAVASLCNFWEHRSQNPEKKVEFKFLSTGSASTEARSTLGDGVKGLELWERAARDAHAALLLASFLSQMMSLPLDFRTFLMNSTPEQLRLELFQQFRWELGSPDVAIVERTICETLIRHGEKFSVAPRDAIKVLPHLYQHVLKVSYSTTNRRLSDTDWRVVFDECTQISISRTDLQALTKTRLAINSLPLGSEPDELAIAFESDDFIAPRPPEGVYPRFDFQAKVVSNLQASGLVFLFGGSGVGKSTIAKLLTVSNPSKWLWASFSGKDAESTLRMLRALARRLDHDRLSNIVLDDMDITVSNMRVFGDLFFSICHSLRQNAQSVFVTTPQRPFSEIVRKLGISNAALMHLPLLNQNEICSFILLHDCPSQYSDLWSRIIYVETSGHPQLAHARVLRLKALSWPSPALVLGMVSEEIGEVQAAARQRLMTEAGSAEKDLILRLSLFHSAFRRDHVLGVAEIPPAIQSAGDIFDSMVGPWIDAEVSSYFRLSPLLWNAAAANWSPSQQSRFRREIADVVCNLAPFTLREADAALFQAILGANRKSLLRVVFALNKADDENIAKAASVLHWVVAVDTDAPPLQFMRDDDMVFLSFALLQVRLSIQADLDIRVRIVKRILKQMERLKSDLLTTKAEFAVLTRLVSTSGLEIGFDILIKCLVECHRRVLHEPEVMRTMNEGAKPPNAVLLDEGQGALSALLSLVIVRCKNAMDLERFLECFALAEVSVRASVLKPFGNNVSLVAMMMDHVCLGEEDREVPDWANLVRVLRNAAERFNEWGFLDASATILTRVASTLFERCNDTDGAIKTLDHAYKIASASRLLIDELRAFIWWQQSEPDRALMRWKRLIQDWPPASFPWDTSGILVSIKAGCAAGTVGKWPLAARFFARAAQRADQQDLIHYKICLAADEGYALWKAGRACEAKRRFSRALFLLENDKVPEQTRFGLEKIVGSVILWVKSVELGEPLTGLAEPTAAFCSTNSADRRLNDLKPTPADFSWLHLCQLEDAIGTNEDVWGTTKERIISSRLPTVRFFANLLLLKKRHARKHFDNFPTELIRFIEAHARLKTIHPSLILDPIDSGQVTAITPDLLAREHFVGALVSAAPARIRRLMLAWESDISDHPLAAVVRTEIELIRRDSILPSALAEKILRNRDELVCSKWFACLAVTPDARPIDLFLAHAHLFFVVRNSPWSREIGRHFSKTIASQWLKVCEAPFFLQVPRVTVPALRAVCQSKERGLAQAARVLLAAESAVPKCLSSEDVARIREVAQGN